MAALALAFAAAGFRFPVAVDLVITGVATGSASDSESDTFPTTCLLLRALDERVNFRAELLIFTEMIH